MSVEKKEETARRKRKEKRNGDEYPQLRSNKTRFETAGKLVLSKVVYSNPRSVIFLFLSIFPHVLCCHKTPLQDLQTLMKLQ